jgi:heme exporter protein B
MQNMFKPDFQNGSIEQLLLSKRSFVGLISTKIFSYWVFTSLPLIMVSVFIASIYFVSGEAILIIQLTLLLSTLTMTYINAFTAAITLGIRYPGALMTLIIAPITLPILIFGSKAIENSILGLDISGPLYFLAGMMMLSLFLGPWITASALKISMD